MKEKWKEVVGYSGLYEVSNIGRVRSLDRKAYRKGKSKSGFMVTIKGKILKNKLNHGYHHIHLYTGGKYRTKKVHRLVAKAFIPNPEDKPNVNHIDLDRTNNKVDNLEWCTQQENIDHSIKLGSYDLFDNNVFAKLKNEQVLQIVQLLDTSNMIYTDIAIRFNISVQSIEGIDSGRTWSRLTGRNKNGN